MKVFVAMSVLLALAFAEPPAYRQQNRYYFARQEEETTAYAPVDAPYPPSGWKPAGATLDLPQKQLTNSYIPPRSSAAASNPNVQRQYGAPDAAQPQQGNQEQQQQLRFANSQFQARLQQQQQQQRQQQQVASSQNRGQQRQYFAPAFQPQTNQYGVPEPQEQFQPPRPDQEYGVPLTTTEEPATSTTEVEDATTTVAPQSNSDSEVEPVNSVNELDEEGDLDEQQVAEEQRQRGEYYIALPDGRLQRIQYVSHQDLEAMKYFARIRAENVEPLRGPIYSYSPLREVQFAQAALRLAPASPLPATPEKYELQEEAVVSPPLAALVQYPYDAPSSVIPLPEASSYSANYKAPESRYIVSF